MTTPPPDPGPLEQASAAYRSGRLDQALALAVASLRGEGGLPAAILALLCLAEADQLGPIDQLLALARDRGIAPLALCLEASVALLRRGKRPALVRLATGVPAGHPLKILAIYYAACARLAAGDWPGALEEFDQFRLQVRDYMGLVPFLNDNRLNVPFRQGTLVLPARAVPSRLADAAGRPAAFTDLVWDRSLSGAAPVIHAAFADGRYVARFARDFALALDRPGRALHLHVVNPTPESDAVLAALPDRLADLDLGLSHATDRTYATSTAYACARFFTLPALLARYGRPVIALDIDILALEPIDRIAAALVADRFDFACFLTGRDEPASVHQASVMAWSPTPATHAFLDRLGRFCLPKLHQPARVNWMLDQAALIAILNWQRESGIPFRFLALNQLYDGAGLDAVTRPVTDEKEKASLQKGLPGPAPVIGEGLMRYDWSPEG